MTDYPKELEESWERHDFPIEERLRQMTNLADQLQDDARRLDWLDAAGREESHGFCHTGYGEYRHYVHASDRSGYKYPSAREVIDAAMTKVNKSADEA